MKKLIIAAIGIVVIAALYCGATWYSAVLAQQRGAQMIERMTDRSRGMIKVVARKQQIHFFTASEDVTLSINNPVIRQLIHTGVDESADTQFTVHNDVAFGPFPGFRSVGMARIETTLVLTPGQRKKLIAAIGTDQPLQFLTTLDYFGKSHFDVISSPLEFHSANKEEGGAWKGGRLRLNFTTDLAAATFNGSAPGLAVNGKDNSVLHVDEITLNGAVQSRFEVLFTGNETFGVGNISFSDPAKADSAFMAKNLAYDIHSTADDQFINFGVAADSGEIAYKSTHLKEAHFDFGTSHIDAKSLASLYKTVQDIQTKLLKQHDNANPESPSQQADDIKSKVTKDMLAILQHTPVLTLDNIGFATADGSLKITGTATISDVAEEDISPEVQYQALAKKIHAQADISIDQSLIDHWPVAADNAAQMKQQISALESQGFVTRKGNRLESHIEYRDGKITANGKAVGG
ncbi:MAG: YdgA family protein [Steroidobacter sp.]